jgi:SAM-dependent methyltransferase
LGSHIRQAHGEDALRKAVLTAKEQGMPDADIGDRYGVSFNTLEQIITEAYGTNISVLKKPKRIKRWEPPNFREEATTVWSFRRRGDWATHDGRYRGNWSPYIPRNVILKYSRPGNIVLDYFVGGGTTAVEAKLLRRRCIARDINPGATGITLENLKFSPPMQLFGEGILPLYEPEVSVGDAKDLSDITANSIDLICAHPPYAGIIKYSANIAGDLSKLPVEDFLIEMSKVAQESLRVLKPGGKCVILIGDARKSKHVVPIGFRTIRAFLDAGFSLRELVIKRQHNCKTTGFWYTRSVKYNFLLLAHEYLPIFEKAKPNRASEQWSSLEYPMLYRSTAGRVRSAKQEEMETTTVWVFPREHLDAEIKSNLLSRFASLNTPFVEFSFDNDGDGILQTEPSSKPSLVYIAPPDELFDEKMIAGYREAIRKVSDRASEILTSQGFFVVDTKDVRIGETLWPVGLLLWEDFSDRDDFAIKEIITVVPAELPQEASDEYLGIAHRYLLVYSKQNCRRKPANSILRGRV